MVNEESKIVKNQRGSATVEAVVGFTAFLFAIFTILGIVNFCRAQMLVSAAVDTAAKELSQYSYFYEMSGLKKFEEKLDDNGAVGKNNINEVIGTVDQLYSSINGAAERTNQEKVNVENMLAAGETDLSKYETALQGVENSAEGVYNSITAVSNAFGDIGNDPLLYMRSLVAIIGSETAEVAKRLVAIPLAKAFVSKHFGENGTEAGKKLESLGIEGGLDAMNFNLSKVFADDDHCEIEINVFYKVKIFQFFDWVPLEANISKVAICRAWLGGDDVIVIAKGNDTPPIEDEKPSETPPENSEEPPEDKKPVDTTGSIWHLGDDGYGSEHPDAGVINALTNHFKETYNLGEDSIVGPNYQYIASKDRNNNPTNQAFRWEFGTNPNPKDFDFAFVVSELTDAKRAKDEGMLLAGTEHITYVVYVPENIPDDKYKALTESATNAETDFMKYIIQHPNDELASLSLDIQFEKVGGNYDYESEKQ